MKLLKDIPLIKNDAKISSKNKTAIPAIPIFNYFLTLKKYHANKYMILSFNRIMRIYSDVYDCAMYTLNYEDKYFISIFAHFKHKVRIYAHNFTHFTKNKHK